MTVCEHGMAMGECGCLPCPHCIDRPPHQIIAAFVRNVGSISEVRFALGIAELAEDIFACRPGDFSFYYQGSNLRVRSQVSSDQGRIDFAFYGDGWLPHRLLLLVEIDDPSHWRDQYKAAADRVRDRNHLLQLDVPTIRFSNEEAQAIDSARAALNYAVRAEAKLDAIDNARAGSTEAVEPEPTDPVSQEAPN
jgi:hypothetical protein